MHADIGMSWRNSGNEVIIEALCPKELQPKDLKCTFTTNTLILEVVGKEIATGKLFGPIKPDESTWQFGERLDQCIAIMCRDTYTPDSQTSHESMPTVEALPLPPAGT